MSTASEPVYVTSGFVRLTRPQLIGTMTGLLLTTLLAAIDQTIVGTAEPRIIASLSGFDRYPWVATVYMLASTVSVPIFASLSDRLGRKPLFMSGAVLFVLASAFCGAAGDIPGMPFDGMGQLILFRGFQGIGAGMSFGVLFTIVGDIFSPIERGKYQGLFAALFGVASIFGPTLGGWLTDNFSWRACFYVNLPFGAIAVAATQWGFPGMKPKGSQRRFDHESELAVVIGKPGRFIDAATALQLKGKPGIAMAETLDFLAVRPDGDGGWIGDTTDWFGEYLFGGFVSFSWTITSLTNTSSPFFRLGSSFSSNFAYGP